MKKLILPTLFVGAIALTFVSCEKIKDEIKKLINPFNHTVEVAFELPDNIEETGEYTVKFEQSFNIKEIIKENTKKDNLGIKDISSVKIKSIVLSMEGSDEENNWTNIETLKINLNTTVGMDAGKKDISSSVNIEDKEDEMYSDKTLEFADENIIDYLSDDEMKVLYSLYVKSRKAIHKSLKITAKVDFSFKP